MMFEEKISLKKFEHKLIKLFGREKLKKEKYTEHDSRMYLYKVDTEQKDELLRYCHVATYLRDEKRGWIFPKEQIEEMSNNTVKINME